MITAKELGHILIAIVVFAFVASFPNLEQFFVFSLFGLIILSVFIISKKLVAYWLETEIEMKTWMFQRYGIYERSYLRTPIPAGVILPFLLAIISLGYVRFLGLLQTDEKALRTRVARRHDFYSYSELTEFHIGLIAASGIFFTLILSIIAYLIGFPVLAKFSIYFALSNILPLGKLDGTKLLMGSKLLYAILAVICLIFFGYALFLP